ncbi:glyceraldehyde 3-phosphate dehydrogenase [Penicillium digitatum]|uniref:Uncharacterized protein n=3 Tax=Penicillium digitatum TaxID=36651 RepID=K9GGA3_PEND2|nr:hypothetical protein PDIP_05410 [Penicillium digitatum Pd1]EKV13788.1 hypothetical protein PDIG_36070 [Penicillium digitatum PHI26]EKV21546.1 hypothetical protein PDIP_05410 [Penicillium digitatum Pd1]QQK42156.1 glyceraldehyde 3-phosphate dehydrogenase [Penicillium digitatum]
MSGLRNTMKSGWHPEGKEGGKESWRGDFKGINQVAGWMGKGKEGESSGTGSKQTSEPKGGIRSSVSEWMKKGKEDDSNRSDHVSRPLSSLKDPSSFGPPPKHINYHGAAAVPNQTTPDRRGLGASLSQDQINAQKIHRQQATEAEEKQLPMPAPPQVPYRVDTSGLSTDNIPPPPVRRLDSASSASTSSISKEKPPKPPPRLPARNGSPSSDPPPVYSSAPVLSHDYINQDAISRLANAGVSVPGLGIGRGRSSSPAHTPVNELQSRFSQIATSRSPSTSTPPAQAPMNIESQFASSISSIHNFNERHADSIESGKQKYGDIRERHASTIDSGKQKFGDFRERHADSIDSGKQKLSDYALQLTSSSPAAPSPPARPASNTTSSVNSEPAEPARGTSSVQGFRERHADKIDMGKEKWSGVTSRFNTFVEDRKFSAEANKRIPRPLPPSRPFSVAQSNSAAVSPVESDLQTQAQHKKASPAPPPKRAEFRASPVDALSPSAPGPPPIPHSTKPR